MIEKTIYIADDGTEFEDEIDCYRYETNKNFSDTIKNNELIMLDSDFTTAKSLGSAQYVICKTKKSVDYLHALNEEFGYWSYSTIEKPGTYYYDESSSEFADWDAYYSNCKKINESLTNFVLYK